MRNAEQHRPALGRIGKNGRKKRNELQIWHYLALQHYDLEFDFNVTG